MRRLINIMMVGAAVIIMGDAVFAQDADPKVCKSTCQRDYDRCMSGERGRPELGQGCAEIRDDCVRDCQ